MANPAVSAMLRLLAVIAFRGHAAGTCKIGQAVSCSSGGPLCTGGQCCPDGHPCPSSDPSFHSCVNGFKLEDCTGDPTPPLGTCMIGDLVDCDTGGPAAGGVMCSGNQCCPNGSPCPSASPDFHECANNKKTHDCISPAPTPPSPTPPTSTTRAPMPAAIFFVKPWVAWHVWTPFAKLAAGISWLHLPLNEYEGIIGFFLWLLLWRHLSVRWNFTAPKVQTFLERIFAWPERLVDCDVCGFQAFKCFRRFRRFTVLLQWYSIALYFIWWETYLALVSSYGHFMWNDLCVHANIMSGLRKEYPAMPGNCVSGLRSDLRGCDNNTTSPQVEFDISSSAAWNVHQLSLMAPVAAVVAIAVLSAHVTIQVQKNVNEGRAGVRAANPQSDDTFFGGWKVADPMTDEDVARLRRMKRRDVELTLLLLPGLFSLGMLIAKVRLEQLFNGNTVPRASEHDYISLVHDLIQLSVFLQLVSILSFCWLIERCLRRGLTAVDEKQLFDALKSRWPRTFVLKSAFWLLEKFTIFKLGVPEPALPILADREEARLGTFRKVTARMLSSCAWLSVMSGIIAGVSQCGCNILTHTLFCDAQAAPISVNGQAAPVLLSALPGICVKQNLLFLCQMLAQICRPVSMVATIVLAFCIMHYLCRLPAVYKRVKMANKKFDGARAIVLFSQVLLVILVPSDIKPSSSRSRVVHDWLMWLLRTCIPMADRPYVISVATWLDDHTWNIVGGLSGLSGYVTTLCFLSLAQYLILAVVVVHFFIWLVWHDESDEEEEEAVIGPVASYAGLDRPYSFTAGFGASVTTPYAPPMPVLETPTYDRPSSDPLPARSLPMS